MGREVREFDIEGQRYAMALLSTSEGAKVLPKIVALSEQLAAGRMEVLNEIDLVAFARPFAEATQVIGPGGRASLTSVFDEHFAGRYDLFLLWIGEAVKYNFGPFFANRKSVFEKLKAV